MNGMTWAIVVGVALVLVLALRGGKRDVSEAKKAVAGGAKLVDVRTPEEFAAGHVTGAVNIPVGDLPRRIKDFGAKDVPVVVYCRSGARSASAKRQLEAAGFATVLDVGAMSNW